MAAILPFETVVTTYKTMRCHEREDGGDTSFRKFCNHLRNNAVSRTHTCSEDGGDTSLRNICNHLQDSASSQTLKPQ
jgi:hypothetical protein